MSNISKETLSRVLEHNDVNTDDKTCNEFNISPETLNRYKRKGRIFGFGEPKKLIDMPNILIFDIETAPMEVFVWGLYKQRISHDNVIQDWFILS